MQDLKKKEITFCDPARKQVRNYLIKRLYNRYVYKSNLHGLYIDIFYLLDVLHDTPTKTLLFRYFLLVFP